MSTKVVLITGSSSGIGAATAEAFAADGYNVVVTGRNAERVQAVVEKCKAINSDPLGVVADITVPEDISKLISSTIAKYGRLDVLVNNAGVSMESAVKKEGDAGMEGFKLTDADFKENHDSIFATNVNAVVDLTCLAVPHLVKTKGNVVNISSVAAVMPSRQFISYCMSKAALDMFTRSAAMALAADGVRVNGIHPAGVLTPMFTQNFKTEEEAQRAIAGFGALHPIGRIGQPKDIADMIVFMASDKATWLTGENVTLDGGFSQYSAWGFASDMAAKQAAAAAAKQ